MNKILFVLLLSHLCFVKGFSQLPNGSVAPNWALTDINGNSHVLYEYLDSNYTVFIQFQAYWDPNGWSYLNSGALENLYINHGPVGFPNVSVNTTDDVMVFFIEAAGHNLACLQGLPVGCNASFTPAGNWTTVTPFPIFLTDNTVNTNAVTLDYVIVYYPTVYKICPNRIIEEVNQTPNPYNFTSGCYPQTNIPDNNFEAFLEANGMGNNILGDDSVRTINISSVNNLNIGGMNISNFDSPFTKYLK